MFKGVKNIVLTHLEIPKPDEGEVLIKVLASNMCGTDLKTYQRGHPLIKDGTIMGHEYAGIVIESRTDIFKKGDYVVGSNSSPCGNCFFCMKKSYSLCEKIKEELIGFTVNGSYAEYLKIPRRIAVNNLYKFKNSTPNEIACSEPLASVIHASESIPISENDTVAIVGSGAIGLMFLQIMKSKGAKIIITNRTEERLRVAEKFGADVALRVDDTNLDSMIKSATGGKGADIVIEAVGKKETWEKSFNAVRDGGLVVFFGGCSKGTLVTFDSEKIHYGETKIIGSFHHEPKSFSKAVEMIESKKIDVKSLITKKIKLDEIVDGFNLMERKEVIKVSVEP